ncbi:MAG: hypothetical protein RLP15_09005 [Cryomorphaceae bacterium]
MKHLISIFILATWSIGLFSQPPLSKRDQQRKAEFEALIEAEENYETTVNRAEQAFIDRRYVEARMAYEEAIQYNPEKEQWLVSKVKDLDILMARNAARAIDSIVVTAPKLAATALPTPKSHQPDTREVELLNPQVVGANEIDSAQALAEAIQPPKVEPKEAMAEDEKVAPTAPNHTVTSRDIQLTPSPKPAGDERTSKVKVKEDFASFDNGVTEETFTLDHSAVLRVVVKEGIDVIVFKRVKHKWGGEFFFMDDQDVTRRYWEEQVRMYRLKYPSSQE